MTTVVHCKEEDCDVYIGRNYRSKMHWGNPFTHYPNLANKGLVVVGSRNKSIIEFEAWLRGDRHQDLEPERRQWILDNLAQLKDKSLGCFCAPQACHGDVYVKLLKEQINF